jgi:pyrimidine-nucleoside phosphorylase
MHFLPAHLNQKKRDGQALTAAEIQDLVVSVTDGSLSDAQLGAFLMAVCCRGMTAEETAALTLAMRDSGAVLDLASISGRKVDKHSTGGVGDKVSLALAPLVAACGARVPMISGRGLGHTGGTIDKLAAIPGYRTELSRAEFVTVLERCGFVMAGASSEIAPADRRMYAVRDVTGTIESIPLITASILSKKLAEGIDALVLDVKCGRAAFMKRRDDARALLQSIVRVGRATGKEVSALLTDMDQPLGLAVGNAVEVKEAIDCLRGEGPADLRELVFALGVEMLLLGRVANTSSDARVRLEHAIASGRALEFLRRNTEEQHGDARVVDEPSRLPQPKVTLVVQSPGDGYVSDIDPLAVGNAAVHLGAGRRQPADAVDPAAGIVLRKQLGDVVRRADPLAVVHASSEALARQGAAVVLGAFRLAERKVERGPLVLERSGAS